MNYFAKVYLLLLMVMSCCAKPLYLVPLSGGEQPESFFDSYGRDDCMKALCDLRYAFSLLGYELTVATIDQAIRDETPTILFDTLVYKHKNEWQYDHHNPNKWFLFLWEPPTVMACNYDEHFHYQCAKVFTLFDQLVDNKKYHKFYYPQPHLKIIADIVPFSEKKLCTFIACNKMSYHPKELYSHRLEVIKFFEHNAPQDFDFYGAGWQHTGFRTYKGRVENKMPYLKNYKFCFCYENMKNNGGYITEKIFDAMVAGCVPIYLGAANISNYIPRGCFIAREDFTTMEELYGFLNAMPEDVYTRYLENIRNFFASDAATLFSIEHFIDTVLEVLMPGYDKTRVFLPEQLEKVLKSKKIKP